MGRSAAFQLILEVTTIKRSATCRQEVEVTRDGTSTEVDSQLGIQAQLKHEIVINTETKNNKMGIKLKLPVCLADGSEMISPLEKI